MIDTAAWYWPVLIAPFIGSFLGVIVTRAENPAGIVSGRSACASCGGRIHAYDLVPVLSFIALRGHCRLCGARIGMFHPLIELAAVVIALWAGTQFSGWLLWLSCGFGWALLALAVTDLEYFLLPDFLTLPLIPAGLVAVLLLDASKLPDHAIGAAAAYLFVVALREVYRRFRGREGMGMGDAKLLAVSGAWISWEGLPTVLLLGAFTGLSFAAIQGLRGVSLSPTSRVPFGTFLCLGTWAVWLYGPLTAG